jgi:oxaloacetate decarboxylase beta subunit
MRIRLLSSALLAAMVGFGGLAHAQSADLDNELMSIPEDDVFDLRAVDEPGTYALHYTWPDEAVVYDVTCEPGKTYEPGRALLVLKIKHKDKTVQARSKAHLKSGLAFEVQSVDVRLGQHLAADHADPLLVLRAKPVYHDSIAADEKATGGLKIGETFVRLIKSTGIYELIARTGDDWTLGVGRVLMILVGLVLLYLAIAKGFEPLLLVPIGFGAIMTNIPLANLSGPDGILGILYSNFVETGLAPLLIFMGVGAMTDFGPLIANPKTALLGAAAQTGIFLALLGALLLEPICGFSLKDAAAIGIIGGADGPTSIFLATRLSPKYLGAIAVAAYS